jgi:hypothetical protein
MKNFEEFINEAANYKDRSGKSFKVKGINFVYTEQRNRFYGTGLYDVAKTANVSKRSKIGLDDTNKLLKSMGIKNQVPAYYETDDLDKVCKELRKKGIVCDYGDYMDVS